MRNHENEELCPHCSCPVHPNMPCSEVVALSDNQTDQAYFRLLKEAINGPRKKNRTGVDTFGVFGEQAKFDVRMDAFPILTTKRVWFKGIVHELLWFIKGDTNIKYLVDNGVHIWDEWAYKRYTESFAKAVKANAGVTIGNTCYSQEEFIQRIKEDPEFAEKWGELGEGTYGGMWRGFPYYDQEEEVEDGEVVRTHDVFGRVDQLAKVMDKLKTNPDDRRMIVSAWHPYWIDRCALPPCHCLFHFNTEELTDLERSRLAEAMGHNVGWTSVHEINEREYDKLGIPRRRLNLLLYQRSCDTFLGVPFNITSYSLLLAMVAHCSNMVPGTFIHTFGDLHVYQTHVKQVAQQLMRDPYPLPQLWLNPDKKDLFKFTFEDIKLENYKSHPTIKAPIAV